MWMRFVGGEKVVTVLFYVHRERVYQEGDYSAGVGVDLERRQTILLFRGLGTIVPTERSASQFHYTSEASFPLCPGFQMLFFHNLKSPIPDILFFLHRMAIKPFTLCTKDDDFANLLCNA